MSSSRAAAVAKKFIKSSKPIQRAAEIVRQDVFGHAQQLNIGSGNKVAKKMLTGPYLEQYYPTPISTYARKVMPGWETDQEEYRRIKNLQQRRRGKGAPKKGEGARAQKK
mmetsp:Transcript_1032/g.3017  ORF Transcript_1032/g.3017 Transcript_1032/m.3017 type:complete len:110 (-) Transcript_1032:1535-1864(-)